MNVLFHLVSRHDSTYVCARSRCPSISLFSHHIVCVLISTLSLVAVSCCSFFSLSFNLGAVGVCYISCSTFYIHALRRSQRPWRCVVVVPPPLVIRHQHRCSSSCSKVMALDELFAVSIEQPNEQGALSGGLSSHILPARWHVVLSPSIQPLGRRLTCYHSSQFEAILLVRQCEVNDRCRCRWRA